MSGLPKSLIAKSELPQDLKPSVELISSEGQRAAPIEADLLGTVQKIMEEFVYDERA